MMGRKAAKSATVSEQCLALLKNSKTLAFKLVRLTSSRAELRPDRKRSGLYELSGPPFESSEEPSSAMRAVVSGLSCGASLSSAARR